MEHANEHIFFVGKIYIDNITTEVALIHLPNYERNILGRIKVCVRKISVFCKPVMELQLNFAIK